VAASADHPSIVIAGSLVGGSAHRGIELGLRRVAEGIAGCIIGVSVSVLMARL